MDFYCSPLEWLCFMVTLGGIDRQKAICIIEKEYEKQKGKKLPGDWHIWPRETNDEGPFLRF